VSKPASQPSPASKPSIVNTWQSIALAAAGLCLVLAIAHLQPAVASEPIDRLPIAETLEQPMAKRQLVTAVLQELGVAKRYDLYIGNAIDLMTSPNQSQQLIDWLTGAMAERSGWKTVSLKYSRRLEDTFSESELQEILALAQNPTFRKFLQAELDSYLATRRDRQIFFFRFWNDYHNNMIPVPEGMSF
jgi:hypothetical protein